MNTFIKILAIALAVCIIVGMIFAAIFVIAKIANFFSGNLDLGEMNTYEISQDVTNFELEIGSADVNIILGDKLSLQTNIKNIKYSDKNGKLKINYKPSAHIKGFDDAVLNITIPSDKVFEVIDIKTGAGKLYVKKLNAKNIHMKLGAGRVDFDELYAYENAQIRGGAGAMCIKNGELNNLILDMGVGELELTSKVKGYSKFNLGIGSTIVNLLGNKKDYCITVDKGIGDAIIDGKQVGNGEYGSGDSLIKVRVGIGSFKAIFEK